MSEHRFRLRRGEFEFEVAGDRDFVEAHVERLMAQLGDGFWRSQDMAPPAAAAVEADLPAHLSETAIPRVREDFRPKVNVSLEEFLRLKEARSPVDMLVVTAYYLEKYLRRDQYTPGDLQAQLSSLPAWECRDAGQEFETAVAHGYFDALRDERYTLTYKGQTYVRNGLVHD